MSFVVSWILFPALLVVLSLGTGLLIDWAAGFRLDNALLLPVGLCGIVVLSELLTYEDATSGLATPAVLVFALVGLLVARGRLFSAAPGPWAIFAALGVFVVFAAPVALTGTATFAGYTVLGDTAIHFVLADRLLDAGRSLQGLEDSSYRAALAAYFNSGYPVGPQVALGAVRPLTGQDIAWIFQPYLAVIAAFSSLSLYSIARRAIERPRLRALAAFVAAQSALVFSFSLQGSVKEMAVVLCLATAVALLRGVVDAEGTWRRLIPLAVVSAAALESLGLGVLPWLGLVLLIALGWVASAQGNLATARDAVVFSLLAAAFALPVLLVAGDYLTGTNALVNAEDEIGNLFGPLSWLQATGVWLRGDYRVSPGGWTLDLTRALAALVLVSAAGGTIWSARRRDWPVVALIFVAALGSLLVLARGSAWIDAKALMIASPAIVLLAMIGASALLRWRRPALGWALLVVLCGVVLYSNALAYHEVSNAPRGRMAELERIGHDLDGKGPTLYVEFEEFAKHFLRAGDPTGWSEAYGPGNGKFGEPTRIDQIPAEQLERYRTIVQRRSPVADRPPSPYRLAFSGRYYEVWQRPEPAGSVLAHIGTTPQLSPSAVIPCASIRRLATLARDSDARLIAMTKRAPIVVDLTKPAVPDNWGRSRQFPLLMAPNGPSRFTREFTIEKRGNYQVWLRGTFSRALHVEIDGRPLKTVSNELNGKQQYARLGALRLSSGRHQVTIDRSGGDLRPGDGAPEAAGPLILEPATTSAIRPIAPGSYRRLCGKDLDWAEVVGDPSSE